MFFSEILSNYPRINSNKILRELENHVVEVRSRGTNKNSLEIIIVEKSGDECGARGFPSKNCGSIKITKNLFQFHSSLTTYEMRKMHFKDEYKIL